jgi:hypothetical protein
MVLVISVRTRSDDIPTSFYLKPYVRNIDGPRTYREERSSLHSQGRSGVSTRTVRAPAERTLWSCFSRL